MSTLRRDLKRSLYKKRIYFSFWISLIGILLLVGLRAGLRGGPSFFLFKKDPVPLASVEVRGFQFFQNAPESTKHWVARFEKHEQTWIISSPPSGVSLVDRRADGNFIHHVLDALKTMRWNQTSLQGPLQAFGLQPPRYALQWESAHQLHVLHVGDKEYVKKGGENLVFVGRGALFSLLQHAQDFESWRDQKLLTFEMDDIDEIEIIKWKGSRAHVWVHAEREGIDWVDLQTEKHRQARPVLALGVKQLNDLKIIQFKDDPRENHRFHLLLDQKKDFEISFKDRKGSVKKLTILRVQNQFLAESSERGDAVFEIPMLSFFYGVRAAPPVY
jgi:hypothetical protein